MVTFCALKIDIEGKAIRGASFSPPIYTETDSDKHGLADNGSQFTCRISSIVPRIVWNEGGDSGTPLLAAGDDREAWACMKGSKHI